MLYSISERLLMEKVDYSMLFRRFVGLCQGRLRKIPGSPCLKFSSVLAS